MASEVLVQFWYTARQTFAKTILNINKIRWEIQDNKKRLHPMVLLTTWALGRAQAVEDVKLTLDYKHLFSGFKHSSYVSFYVKNPQH